MTTNAIRKGVCDLNSNTTEIPVTLRTPREQEAPGVVSVLEWNRRNRFIRALKTLGLCWGAAIVSVLIPLAHFVLVPALFIAGPVATYIIYQRERVICGGSGTCPNCRATFSVVRSAVKWPLNDMCPSCQTTVQIVQASP